MTRKMYDSTDPANMPTDGDLYGGYVGGSWPTYTDGSLAAHCCGKPTVSIAVASYYDAMVLDVENGDATPDLAPSWATRQRARGQTPTVYCEKSALPAVQDAFRSQNVPEPYYWIAAYSDPPGSVFSLSPLVVAHQYGGDQGAGWDISYVADHWPGVDPAPQPTEDLMKPARTPSWCPRQSNGAYPQFKSYLDGADAVVVSVNNAPFTPAWAEGDHGAYADFAAFGLWCRRFKNAGEPEGFSEQADGAFILNADNGTFDVAHKG